MSNLYFSGGKFLLEYAYGNSDIIASSSSSFRKLQNAYDGSILIVNDNDSTSATGNVVDYSLVGIDSGRLASLDNDNAYFYPDQDPNITVTDVVPSPTLNVEYDTVKLHLLSGYNFDDSAGLVFSVNARMTDGNLLKLCDIVILPGHSDLLKYSSRPFRISQWVYDRFIEIKIPSHKYLLDQQKANPGSSTSWVGQVLGGDLLFDQTSIYFDYRELETVEEINGFTYLYPKENIRYSFANTDGFSDFTGVVRESSDGDFIEYYAAYNGGHIEDYITSLNSQAGNDYIVIHELIISEQLGTAFTVTKRVTDDQVSGYDSPNYFRPVILNASAVSFSIDYICRLFNRADGTSIVKTASISSSNTGKYGRFIQPVNVGNIPSPEVIVNKIVRSDAVTYTPKVPLKTQKIYIPTYINSHNIMVNAVKKRSFNGSDANDISFSGELEIGVNPFTNNYLFFVYNLDSGDNAESINLDFDVQYNLVFIKNDGSKLRITDTDTNTRKSDGILEFEFSSDISQQIRKLSDNNFYITSTSLDKETVIYAGKHKKSEDVEQPTVTTEEVVIESAETLDRNAQLSTALSSSRETSFNEVLNIDDNRRFSRQRITETFETDG